MTKTTDICNAKQIYLYPAVWQWGPWWPLQWSPRWAWPGRRKEPNQGEVTFLVYIDLILYILFQPFFQELHRADSSRRLPTGVQDLRRLAPTPPLCIIFHFWIEDCIKPELQGRLNPDIWMNIQKKSLGKSFGALELLRQICFSVFWGCTLHGMWCWTSTFNQLTKTLKPVTHWDFFQATGEKCQIKCL